MLSVLIPVYNVDVRLMVRELHRQLVEANIYFEIIVLDDASTKPVQELNGELSALSCLRYSLLEQNIGRHRIRFVLAQKALYPQLLFIDCDSLVCNGNFVANYLEKIKPGSVIVGGRSYSDVAPQSRALRLHWKYGRHREQRKALQRNLDPYLSFMTCNFVIPHSVMLRTFPGFYLTGYGHEDTLLGLQLLQSGVPVLHIDNPLQHEGLQSGKTFLEHNQSALKNLIALQDRLPHLTSLLDQKVKLLRTYKRIGLAKRVLPRGQFWIKLFRNLTLTTNSLFFLDVYKILSYHRLKRSEPVNSPVAATT